MAQAIRRYPNATWFSRPLLPENAEDQVLRCDVRPKFETIKSLPCKGKILRDVLVRPAGVKTSKSYGSPLRLVTALVEVKGVERKMTFVTPAVRRRYPVASTA